MSVATLPRLVQNKKCQSLEDKSLMLELFVDEDEPWKSPRRVRFVHCPQVGFGVMHT